jgi:hypothetical protein
MYRIKRCFMSIELIRCYIVTYMGISELPGAMYPMVPLIPMELLEFTGFLLVD